MNYNLVVVVIIAFCIRDLAGYPSGAPDDPTVCTDMDPYGHLTPQNSGPPPFVVELSSANYSASSEITVTLRNTSAVPFKGFLLQARRADTGTDQITAVGTFDVTNEPDARSTCNAQVGQDSAVTHVDATSKSSVTVVWKAPSTSQGNIVIRATVVEVFDQSAGTSRYWENILSSQISGESPPPVTGTEPTQGTTEAVTEEDLPHIDDSGCGQSKGCYRDPPQCTPADCKYILTWKVNGDAVDFEIESQVSDITSWAAVGFSTDDKMGDDSVNDCTYDSTTGTTKVQASWNDDTPYNTVLNDPNTGLKASNSEGASADGRIQCSFTRYIHVSNITGSDAGKMFNLSNSYYLFLGRGPSSSGVVGKHDENPIIAPQKIDVSDSSNYVDIGGTVKNSLVITHGALMIFAWLVFVNVGVLMPRYYKSAWPGEELCGKQIWFQLHRPIMVMGATLTIIAFIIIFVEVGGYAKSLTGADAVHPILGIIVTALAITNPIMAVFRPHPGTPNRFIFNWAHFGVGTSAQVLAAVTVFLGTRLGKAAMSSWAQWLVVGCIAWHCFIEIVLAAHQCYTNKPRDSSVEDLKQSSDSMPNVTSNKYSSNEEGSVNNVTIFKTAIIVVHFIGVSLFATALVVDLAS